MLFRDKLSRGEGFTLTLIELRYINIRQIRDFSNPLLPYCSPLPVSKLAQAEEETAHHFTFLIDIGDILPTRIFITPESIPTTSPKGAIVTLMIIGHLTNLVLLIPMIVLAHQAPPILSTQRMPFCFSVKGLD